MKEFRLSVHGSRTLKDERVKIILLEEIQKHGVTHIVTHAEPDGVCGVARKLCKEIAMPLTTYFLNFRYLRGAFEHRSKDVLNNSDHAVYIHDGKSKGTTNEKKLGKKMGVPCSEYTLEPAEFENSIGFPVDGEWGQDIADDWDHDTTKELAL